MSETRDIVCQCGCGEVLGTITLASSSNEQEWTSRLLGFKHEHCVGDCDPETCEFSGQCPETCDHANWHE